MDDNEWRKDEHGIPYLPYRWPEKDPLESLKRLLAVIIIIVIIAGWLFL